MVKVVIVIVDDVGGMVIIRLMIMIDVRCFCCCNDSRIRAVIVVVVGVAYWNDDTAAAAVSTPTVDISIVGCCGGFAASRCGSGGHFHYQRGSSRRGYRCWNNNRFARLVFLLAMLLLLLLQRSPRSRLGTALVGILEHSRVFVGACWERGGNASMNFTATYAAGSIGIRSGSNIRRSSRSGGGKEGGKRRRLPLTALGASFCR